MIGKKINNYEIRSLLGEGGMGAVYLAEHPMIGRKVAIKILKRELAEDPVLVQRFFNEARAANAIGHPNIIDIIDVGQIEGGLPYLIMEFLDGESLAEFLRRKGRLPAALAVDLVAQAASALAAAHDKGIVHRDLKPDNLFLVKDPTGSPRPKLKVLDFGIAKLRKELSGEGVTTTSGSVMGTPPYMSPEQCMGITTEIDQRTDVYALGIILYELVCGRPPFLGRGMGEVMMKHMGEAPRPPTELNPDVTADLEQTILKALIKNRDDRLGSMQELRTALGCPPDAGLLPTAPGRPTWSRPIDDSAVSLSVPTIDAPIQPGGTVVLAQLSADRLAPGADTAAGSAGRTSTTFSSTAGSIVSPPPSRGGRRWGLVVGGAVVALAAVAAYTLVGRSPSSAPGAAMRPAQPFVVTPPPVIAAPPPVEIPLVPDAPDVTVRKEPAPDKKSARNASRPPRGRAAEPTKAAALISTPTPAAAKTPAVAPSPPPPAKPRVLVPEQF